ncbi:MAG: hypothetical protein ACTHKC_09215 [Candidatus Nitrosocosmicus sp.]
MTEDDNNPIINKYKSVKDLADLIWKTNRKINQKYVYMLDDEEKEDLK